MVYMEKKYNTKNYLLKILEENRGKPVLGSVVAKELNLSRAAVSLTVKALKKDGYLIKAVQNRGYTLLENNDMISVSGISPYLRDQSISQNIVVKDVLESTNKTAKFFALDGAPHGTVIISDSQTAGKGRGGKLFYSEKSAGLYMSIVLCPSAIGLSDSVEIEKFTPNIENEEPIKTVDIEKSTAININSVDIEKSALINTAININSVDIKQPALQMKRKEPIKATEIKQPAELINSVDIEKTSPQTERKEPVKTAAVLTQIAAAAVVLAITRVCGVKPRIKRVNDIYLDDKKISGILTEVVADLEMGNIQFAVVGVGINTGIRKFPEELKDTAASVFSPSGNTRNRLAAELINLLLSPTSPDFIDELLKVYDENHSEN
jgi:BirA family biotin operon repressor/biotin-[acetyl-CoA-carboxylase] ligase